jgi:hypothetical protein
MHPPFSINSLVSVFVFIIRKVLHDINSRDNRCRLKSAPLALSRGLTKGESEVLYGKGKKAGKSLS